MRHAHDNGFGPCLGGTLDDGVQCRDGDLAAFEPKPLGSDETLLAERLEALGLGQMLEDRALCLVIISAGPGRSFDPLLQPGFALRILHVHVFETDRPAVAASQDVEERTHRGGALSHEIDRIVTDMDRVIERSLVEAVAGRVKVGVRSGLLQAERVELGLQMAADPVGVDQAHGAQAFVDLDVGGLRLGSGLGGFDRRAVVGERKVVGRPGGAGGVLEHGARLVVESGEQFRKARINAGRVLSPACVEVGDIGCVCATECARKDVNARHYDRRPSTSFVTFDCLRWQVSVVMSVLIALKWVRHPAS